MPIKDYSTTAGNNTASPPNGAPVGTTKVSQLDDIQRQVMADIRDYYNTPEWRDLGNTVTFVSSTSFRIGSDVTASYRVGQRIRITDSSTLYGTIASATFSSPNTTIVVTLDSGSITSSITAVALGLNPDNKPIPAAALSGTFVSSVALAAPSEFTVSGSPVTSTGTLTLTKANQNANLVFAGPSSGSAAAPTFRALAAADLPARTQVVLTSGTSWSVPAGVSLVFARLVGGGGGGGGAGAANTLAGGGGGAGGYCEGFFSVTPGGTVSYTIGGAGGGGSAGANNGSAGGNTTFSTMTANGGGAGSGASSFNVLASGGAGGTASGGTINLTGQDGLGGFGTSGGGFISGAGGTPAGGFGVGASGRNATAFSQGSGNAGVGYGAGGSGGYSTGTAQAGGSGGAGVIVLEY